MSFKQKNTKLLLPVFAFIFLIIFTLGSIDYEQLGLPGGLDFERLFKNGISLLKSYNLMTKITINNKTASDDVVLVITDDKSLSEIGRWPWKRDYYLEIFDYLENYTNAKLIGYDAIITMPDFDHPKSDKKFFSEVKNLKKLTAGVVFSYEDFDENFDKTKEYEELLQEKSNINIIDKRSEKYKKTSEMQSFSVLQHEYFKNVASLGTIQVPEDIDGYTRRIAQLIDYKNRMYPSLSLAIYAKHFGIKEFELTDKYLKWNLDNISYNMPIDNVDGFVFNYICYYKSLDSVYSHKKYSSSDIINSYRAIKKGKKPIIDPSEFDNKFVIVGANAQALALADVKRTPISESYSGADIQATNLDNLLTNNFIKRVNVIYNFLSCCLIIICTIWFVNTLPTSVALLSSTCIGFLYFAFAYLMYYRKTAVDLFLPEFSIIFALLCAYSYKYLIENSKKTKIQKAMGKYLSNEVMQNVVQNIDNIKLGGKRADITVLFADIRNFTTISENMDAASTSVILNEYFSAMVPIIEENNGVLNKFMGDAVLAIFGEPKKSENHALDAVKCGYRMLKKVQQLQEKWLDEGKPKIEIGIGISSGDAFVGNIGSSERLEYTVIGDTVNTASRIENYNKIYKTNFLISEETYNRTKNSIDVIAIKDVAIRGKANKINLYEVIRLTD